MTDEISQSSNVLKFRALVDSDPALQREVRLHVGGGHWNAAAIVEIGRDRGLAFSASELVELFEEDEELSDFELEMVAAAIPQSCVGGGV